MNAELQMKYNQLELAIIGAVLSPQTKAETHELIFSKLNEAYFSNSIAGDLFGAAKKVYSENQDIDLTAVFAETGESRQYKELAAAGLECYISESLIPNHVKRISDHYRLGKLCAKLKSLIDDYEIGVAPKDLYGDLKAIMDEQARLEEIQECSTSMDMSESIWEYIQHMYSKDRPAFRTGMPLLDCILGGFLPKNYYVISGRSGGGKSDLSIFLATALAIKGARVLYLTMEMPRTQIMERIASRITKINSAKLRDRALTAEEKECVTLALDKLSEIPLILDEQQNLTIQDIRQKIRRHRPDVVFIDHIGLMKLPPYQKQWENTYQNSKEIKQLAMKHDIAFVVMAQQNKEIESRRDKSSNLGDLKGSDGIGNDADAVMFISAEKPDHFLRGDEFVRATLQISKNRHGSLGKLYFNWYPQYHKYIPCEYDNGESGRYGNRR